MEIEKFKKKEVSIANEVANYYLTLGSDYVVSGLKEEGQTENYTIDFSKMGDLSEDEKQEVWEVILLMMLKYEHEKLGMRRYVAGVSYNFLSHYALAREWHILLRVYNNDIMSSRMQEYLFNDKEIKWQDLKDFYAEYKEVLGRECYVTKARISVDDSSLQEYLYVRKQQEDFDNLYVNSLDDVIEDYEKRYPVLLEGNVDASALGFREWRDISSLANRYRDFCSVFFMDEVEWGV